MQKGFIDVVATPNESIIKSIPCLCVMLQLFSLSILNIGNVMWDAYKFPNRLMKSTFVEYKLGVNSSGQFLAYWPATVRWIQLGRDYGKEALWVLKILGNL